MFFVIILLKIQFILENIHTAETILTLQTVAICGVELQAFARIIFVDNALLHPRKLQDHAPLEKMPSFDSVSIMAPKVVSF